MLGRRVVVTGVGGIGTEVARQVVATGGRVHLVDIAPGHVTPLAADLQCAYTVADLSTRSTVDRAFRDAEDSLGGIDALVAIAGGSGRRIGDGPVHEIDEAALAGTVGANLTPAALALGAFIRHRDTTVAGSVVLTGSVLARHPHPLFATHCYAAAKAAIEGLAIAGASFYADQGVRINVVAPGLTRTPMSARAQADPASIDFARRKQPLADDGFVDPASVAAACCALVTNAAITGQVVAVDSGWSVR